MPTSLSKVLSGQSRTVKVDVQNTDKCREADIADDMDGNGISDSVQPLYLARQGDASVQHKKPDNTVFNEDPSKIYLFRNYHASEAQLGISDYSPTGTAAGSFTDVISGWNLLASSQEEYIPGYNKLVMLTNSSGRPVPTLLTKKQNGQCVGYQPSSTDVIKMITQYTRVFIKLTALPIGVNCE